MLQLNQLSLRRGDRLLFADATFQVYPGQRLGVTGANGSGKSSLFEAILGGLEPDEGQITLDAGCRIAHVAQESPSSKQTALDYVLDGDAELRAQLGVTEGLVRVSIGLEHEEDLIADLDHALRVC